MADGWSIGKDQFTRRLLVGTGKYPDFPTMQRALAASGAELDGEQRPEERRERGDEGRERGARARRVGDGGEELARAGLLEARDRQRRRLEREHREEERTDVAARERDGAVDDLAEAERPDREVAGRSHRREPIAV